MKYNIITSFNEKYWQEVTKENIELLDEFLTEQSRLFLYHQLQEVPKNFKSRVEWLDLYSTCPELPEFVEAWKDHPKANGSVQGFRSNAVKFVHKTFPIWHRAKLLDEGWLIWLDADVIPLREIDINFFSSVCPDDKMISFMGRPGKYSECGFIGFNVSHTDTLDFIKEWEELYVSGKFIELKETHDSWTFDWLRKQKDSDRFFNVNADAKTNKNPFSQSLLKNYFAHAKGDKKQKQSQRLKSRLS